jgi:hypothetical protein
MRGGAAIGCAAGPDGLQRCGLYLESDDSSAPLDLSLTGADNAASPGRVSPPSIHSGGEEAHVVLPELSSSVLGVLDGGDLNSADHAAIDLDWGAPTTASETEGECDIREAWISGPRPRGLRPPGRGYMWAVKPPEIVGRDVREKRVYVCAESFGAASGLHRHVARAGVPPRRACRFVGWRADAAR